MMRDQTIEIPLPGGIKLPVAYWTIHIFGVIAVVAIAFGVYRYFYPAMPELISLQQANHALSVEVREYNAHIMEGAEREETLFDDPRGALVVRLYRDGCLLIQRKVPGAAVTRMIPDLSRTVEHRGGDEIQQRLSSLALLPAVEAQGRCLNPHPGPFETTYGTRNGCLVEVWRAWPDSCTHTQLLNTCNNTWDTNPDGTPRVTWRRCVH